MLRVEERPCRIGIRLDEVERAAVDAAVKASGLSLSDWVRRALADAAKAQTTLDNNVFVRKARQR